MAQPLTLQQALTDTDARYCKAARRLLENTPLLQQVQTHLAAWGVQGMAGYVGAGDNAVVLQPSKDSRFVVRIAFENFDRPAIAQVLQATKSQKLGALRLELLPRLNTRGVELKHIRMLEKGLKENGYRFSDPKPENIGLLPDGTPVILDPGSVDALLATRIINAVRRKKPDNREWQDDNGNNKQDVMLPRRYAEPAPTPETTGPEAETDKWREASRDRTAQNKQKG
ncbi:MAG: hypothetical protein EBV03_02380 [Proteobacteria bacterium]|nr:hypothetical protein [Pseudomonadota bacterium]